MALSNNPTPNELVKAVKDVEQDAETANTNAQNAQNTADEANTRSKTAQNQATNAQTTADNAQNTANTALNDTASKRITTKYTKFFTYHSWNYADRRYQKICRWSAGLQNHILGMTIYTATYYGWDANNVHMHNVALETLNDNHIGGFASIDGNCSDLPIFYAVKTDNAYEWDIYWLCPQWSCATINITIPENTNIVLAEPDDVLSSEPSYDLKITPKNYDKVYDTYTSSTGTFNFLKNIGNYTSLIFCFVNNNNEWSYECIPVDEWKQRSSSSPVYLNSSSSGLTRYLLVYYVSDTSFQIKTRSNCNLIKVYGIK